jgi:hypothetical protein
VLKEHKVVSVILPKVIEVLRVMQILVLKDQKVLPTQVHKDRRVMIIQVLVVQQVLRDLVVTKGQLHRQVEWVIRVL